MFGREFDHLPLLRRLNLATDVQSDSDEEVDCTDDKMEDVLAIQYLKKSNMDTDAIWGSDVEIIAFSKMLDVDIFVANLHNDVKKNECVTGRGIDIALNITNTAIQLFI